MRDIEDDDETAVSARHNELRDIHHRIDSLKEESERQHNSLIERLHALEVAIAAGSRFPAGAWVAIAALVVTILGSAFITYNKIESAHKTSTEAKSRIEEHMSGSSARFQTIQEASQFITEWDRRLPAFEERMKALEGKIVGQGPEGWHRRDHDLYARMMDERNDRIRLRLEMIEKKQEALCQRVQECKGSSR